MDMDRAAEIIEKLTRPLVTLVFSVTLSWGFIAGKLAGEAYLPIAALIMQWWFTQRQADKDAVTIKAADKLVEKMTAPKPEEPR